jgi:uncharacterized membrane protein
MKQRVWELDAFRGICVIGMVFVHFVYDLVELYRFVQWEYPAAFRLLMKGGVFFLLISGICATLGSRSFRRGLIVFGCGLGVTAVTVGMYLLKFSGKEIIISFGVLHCLGICMILWPLFRKLPWWTLALLGLAFVGIGFWFDTLQVQQRWLFPLGLCYEGFAASDYFPLFPNLGWFLLGACLGKTLYREKQTLLPMIPQRNIFVRFFCFCGRNALQIYLIHQPVLAGLFTLVAMLR